MEIKTSPTTNHPPGSRVKLDGAVLTAAYGRTYRNAKTVSLAFIEGFDFLLHHPLERTTYCSIRDFAVGAMVELRYGISNRAATTIVVTEQMLDGVK